MWKPVRLQGVGAASSVIIANTQPAGRMDPWRQRVNCLFGLTLQGAAATNKNVYDPSGQATCPGAGWKYFAQQNVTTGTGGSALTQVLNAQVDPLPLEAIVGWDATQNGNLAQLLQEPSLMGALEGAGITVLAKGVKFPTPLNTQAASAGGTLGSFPTGTTLLSGSVSATGLYSTGDSNSNCHTSRSNTTNPFPSNFSCNPSAIDGLSVTQSSQGGGGIFVHGWAHNLQIANNNIHSNAGTLSGGINLGQGEFAPNYTKGSTTNSPPGSCEDGSFGIPSGAVEPYCQNLNVNVHNNNISLNSSTGDELFSGTPAGAGAISICTGADYYKFNYNWICGNLSTGDGGGVGHLGVSYNGNISNNTIIFNQSLNPTVPANGGGLLVMGTPDIDTTCGGTTDMDCLDPASLRTPSDGIGPNLVINANLIMGNSAESGSGGGLRLQNVNGGDVLAFPTRPQNWWQPTITNNIITDNLAGWDGAGISLQDALIPNIVNNTIAYNTTTATSGILFTTIGAPVASSDQGPPSSSNNGNPSPTGVYNCTQTPTTSCPQPAGLVSVENSSGLQANLPTNITCPAYHSLTSSGVLSTSSVTNGSCRTFSYPLLQNNIFWNNSAYYIGVGALSAQYQQNVVSLYKAGTTTLAANQSVTGACDPTASIWDIGARGDTGPANHSSGTTLSPFYSLITPSDQTTYAAAALHNVASPAPVFRSFYCDGSRTPPEGGVSGFAVPPGIADAMVPNPIFNLQPVATVDEGNNWINLRWGPLSLSNPVTATSASAPQMGNYALNAGLDTVPTSEPNHSLVPTHDFFGTARPNSGNFDPGAVEYQPPQFAILSVTPTTLNFGATQLVGTTSSAQTLTLQNTGGVAATGISVVVTAPFSRPAGSAGGTCGATLAATSTCTINVVFTPTNTTPATGTATISASVAVTGSPVSLSGTGAPHTYLATVTPSALAFGNWPAGTPSTLINPMLLTVQNTGNTALAGGTFSLGGGTPIQFSRVTTGAFPAGAPNCGAGLAVGASCTIKVAFAPGPAVGVTYNRNITVAYTGATVTNAVVPLSGTAIGTNAAVSISPNPLTITDASGVLSKSGTVTFTNNAAAGGSNVAVTNVTVNGAGLIWAFTKGTDSCSGSNLAPGASCTVQVNFTRLGSVGTHAGTVTFTDSGSTSPTGALSGVAQ